MKKLLLMSALILNTLYSLYGQQVPKIIVVEYFTNTYCSICAGRNPGFYANLGNFPEVLHIAYHPSVPYPACPLNQHNITENNAKTTFYSLLNGTPQMAISGTVIPVNEDYGNPALFTSRVGETSGFTINTRIEPAGADSAMVRVSIIKRDTSSLTAFSLYSAVVEDTLIFAANNGEMLHHDVFRKSVFGALPKVIDAPMSVGDSVVHTEKVKMNAAWNAAQVYVISMINTPDKAIIQAGRSPRFIPGANGISEQEKAMPYSAYPIPATDKLYITGDLTGEVRARVIDVTGKTFSETIISRQSDHLDVSTLSPGNYLLELSSVHGIQTIKFNRR